LWSSATAASTARGVASCVRTAAEAVRQDLVARTSAALEMLTAPDPTPAGAAP